MKQEHSIKAAIEHGDRDPRSGISRSLKANVACGSRLQPQEDTPLLLVSHIGRFRASAICGDDRISIRGRIAFSCRPVYPPVKKEESAALPHDQGFQPRYTSFAFDMRTGKHHRLIWGSNSYEVLVTILKPGMSLINLDESWQPRLLPIDQSIFRKLAAARAAVEN